MAYYTCILDYVAIVKFDSRRAALASSGRAYHIVLYKADSVLVELFVVTAHVASK